MTFSIRASTITFSLAAAMAIPMPVLAQSEPQSKTQHHRYRLIDLGTFGGPQSVLFGLAQTLNGRGAVQGIAETTIPDPNFQFENPYIWINYPGYQDPVTLRAFEWQDGILTDLDVLPGGSSSTPAWINSSGVVVGASTNGQMDPLAGVAEIRAVMWKHDQVVDLGTLGGNESVAASVNDREQVTGFALNAVPDRFSIGGLNGYGFFGTQSHAFLWQDGVMRDLGTLGGPDSVGFDINRRGDVARQSFVNSTVNGTTGIPTMDAFLWTNDKMIDLGNLGGTLSYVNDLNNKGEVAGLAYLAADRIFHPFLWDGRKLRDLGTLGGNYGSAVWLNDSGEVAGWANLAGDQVNHAFRWKDGVMTDLGTVNGYPLSIANGINNEGQVVGQSVTFGLTKGVGWVWEIGGPVIDLNTLVPPGSGITVEEAFSINDRGAISANGILSNGDYHAILLIPTD